jgi:hypothetical protein
MPQLRPRHGPRSVGASRPPMRFCSSRLTAAPVRAASAEMMEASTGAVPNSCVELTMIEPRYYLWRGRPRRFGNQP